jgi:hypothetical protein
MVGEQSKKYMAGAAGWMHRIFFICIQAVEIKGRIRSPQRQSQWHLSCFT